MLTRRTALLIAASVVAVLPAAAQQTPLKIYGPPLPGFYGPPLPPARATIVAAAAPVREALASGRIKLLNQARDTEQLARLAQTGVYSWPVPSGRHLPAPLPSRHATPGFRNAPDAAVEEYDVPTTSPSPRLLRLLATLGGHSSKAHPLELISLLRPPYHVSSTVESGPNNPHSLGLAADIAAYAGHAIRQSQPEECVRAVLAIVRDLPPGRYRLGLPKAPEQPAIVGQPLLAPELANLLTELLPPPHLTAPLAPWTSPLSAGMAPSGPATAPMGPATATAIGCYLSTPKKPWPFFPAQQMELIDGVIAPLKNAGHVVAGADGFPAPHIVRFRNESYAPESAIADIRIRKALEVARRRGADVFAVFPDGLDHVHIDVKEVL